MILHVSSVWRDNLRTYEFLWLSELQEKQGLFLFCCNHIDIATLLLSSFAWFRYVKTCSVRRTELRVAMTRAGMGSHFGMASWVVDRRGTVHGSSDTINNTILYFRIFISQRQHEAIIKLLDIIMETSLNHILKRLYHIIQIPISRYFPGLPGRSGSPQAWPAPELVASEPQEARPGFSSCSADEYEAPGESHGKAMGKPMVSQLS